jgi:hypothetical protein
MRGDHQQIETLTAIEVRIKIRRALSGVEVPPGFDLRRLKAIDRAAIRSLPHWIARAGGLQGTGIYCLWCEPLPAPAGTFPSQLVLDIPAGRYMVDTFDVSVGTWCGRESAPGGPLVAGVAYTGGPVLLVVRALSDQA